MKSLATLFFILLVTVNCNNSSSPDPEPPEAWLQVKVLMSSEEQDYVPLLITQVKKDETNTLQEGEVIRVTQASYLTLWSSAEIIVYFQEEGWVYGEFIQGWP